MKCIKVDLPDNFNYIEIEPLFDLHIGSKKCNYKEIKQRIERIQNNDNVYATKNGVIRGTSDHQIFRMYGYPSLVIGDDNIIDIVHTDNDNLDNVDYSYLEKLSEVIYKFISENRYDMNEIKTGS